MKTRLSLIASAVAVAFTMGLLSSCTQQGGQSAAVASDSTAVATGLKIAFVDVDSIATNYKLANELAEAIEKKYNNMKTKLDRDVAAFQKDVETFQDKVQKGIFLTQQRAQEEQQRLLVRQNEIEKLEAEYVNQLAYERQTMDNKIFDKIQSYINEYNATAGYDYIITRTPGNVWFANETYNITAAIIEGLNAAYDAEKK